MSRTTTQSLAALLAVGTILSFGSLASAQTAAPATQNEAAPRMAQPGAEMKSILDKLVDLGAKPIGTLSVEQTRAQPTPADAVMAVMKDKSIAPDPMAAAIKTRDIKIPGAGGEVDARVYTPPGSGPFPLVVYYHGGGWVIADIDTYDASARSLAAGSKAVVVSVDYRHAPEHKFPAAHEDAFAAYKWIVEHSGEMNADATRIAVAGESAGGNLATNVAIMARDAKITQPIHQLLVYPVAGNDMMTPSYQENAEAQPLSKPAMEWFVSNVFADKSQTADKRLNLVGRTDLQGLPPATIINAQIDPLRSEGEAYAEKLKAAGVATEQKTYEGATHEFFGMGTVVPQAKEAMTMATERLTAAFSATSGEATSSTSNAPAPTPAPAN
ncbi:alpha/beta hydrolase [Aureimonas sp. ME7]|uniref:alpha/beta hydrolase n=1 Tax=Aureimonas sp. ME7 TaxID=2744252 RepID=UPI0015F5F7AB|nr:alpha/beta hydrolase [Aureimonas sp. ME7]